MIVSILSSNCREVSSYVWIWKNPKEKSANPAQDTLFWGPGILKLFVQLTIMLGFCVTVSKPGGEFLLPH